MNLESWRIVFRNGIAPQIETRGLESLRDALRNDDPRLTQGSTTTPPPLLSLENCPCDGCDAIGWFAWQGGDGPAKTVGEVEVFFAKICFVCDSLIEPAACRWFLSWFDETPRDKMRAELIEEIEREFAVRDRDLAIINRLFGSNYQTLKGVMV